VLRAQFLGQQLEAETAAGRNAEVRCLNLAKSAMNATKRSLIASGTGVSSIETAINVDAALKVDAALQIEVAEAVEETVTAKAVTIACVRHFERIGSQA